ncbi:MAG: Gfo/Idh/MocA family oxidoreductase [Pirellulales bacterium]|nr:Gfo/Idh/MocA family oxidoreductase [Pirellulales bacterium]
MIRTDSTRGLGTSRRSFLKRSAAAAAALAGASVFPAPWLRAAGANDDVRLGVVGIGSRVKIGGKGRGEIRDFRKLSGVRVVALCDVDSANLDPEVEAFAKRNEKVAAYRDMRKLLDNKEIDAVIVTTPDHWHALATIWACQAGKDVYVQKPASHNIREGRKMVEAARKYKRIVQCPNGSRGLNGYAEAVDFVRRGELGKILAVRLVHFSPRTSIGKVGGPQPIPATLDYDLWSGPAAVEPLMRQNLHYDWHWQWLCGTGEMGNWGIHHLDGCRLFLGGGLPRHAISIGGRFGYDDDGQTPNAHLVYFDYRPAPLIVEIHNLPKNKSFLKNAVPGKDDWGKNSMESYRGIASGKVIHCENGYVVGTVKSHAAFDNDGKKIQEFKSSAPDLDRNFIDVVRSRRAGDLSADIEEGHLSAALVHLGNISHRVGKTSPDGEICDRIEGDKELAAAYRRLKDHLLANGVDFDKTPVTLGPMLTFDAGAERFVGDFSQEANPFLTRKYRPPFVVPEIV